MKLQGIKDITVVIVSQEAMKDFLFALKTQKNVYFVRIHPAALEGYKFASDRLKCIENANIFGIFSHQKHLDEIIQEKCKVAFKSGVECVRPTSSQNTNIQGSLMDNVLELDLQLHLHNHSDSKFVIRGREKMSPQLNLFFDEALEANLALGIDGCSPVEGAALDVNIVNWKSTDPFTFRQEAAIHRVIRAGFLKLLKQGSKD